ncbi:MAG: nicotinamide-nucleotide amidohydrolase family protein [Planctomycetes bacterium]|nr:nicotinamide-nucleotide amidohydrolase family protein [Planctomycetota bacterium]
MNSGPRVCVLSIGDEILNGRIYDTNAAFLGAELLKLSLVVQHHRCTSDQPQQLVKQLSELSAQFDLIISSGGLGPTADDRVADEIKQFELKTTSIANPAGTADGIAVEFESGCKYFALPGPPVECQQSFQQSLLPILTDVFADVAQTAYHTMHFIGTHEAHLASFIPELFLQDANPTLGITASEQGVTISMLARQTTTHSADYFIEQCRKQVKSKLGQWFWGEGDISLASEVVRVATEQQLTFALAESCTGGQVAAALVDIPGASKVLNCCWVTYANDSKRRQLDVSGDLLDEHGAVSEQVAEAMARGALSKSQADFAVSITGVAGPTGGTEDKPVGTVCFAIAAADGVHSLTCQQYSLGGRQRIQRQSVRDALYLFLQAMRGQIVLR